MSALLTQSPGETVQTGTGKVDPDRKFKCTTAAAPCNIKINVFLQVGHRELTKKNLKLLQANDNFLGKKS